MVTTPTIIPINRATIQVNPHAGQTLMYIAGPLVVTEVRVSNRNFRWVREVYVGHAVKDGQLVAGLLHESHATETNERPADWRSSLSSNQSFDALHTISPQPRFLYEYEDVKLTCDDCGEQFLYSELESDEVDDDSYCETVCPRCGAWDCCKPVLEQLPSEEMERYAKSHTLEPSHAP